MRTLFLASALSLVVVACASTPDISLGYNLPKTTVTAKVTRTLTCDASDNIFIANTVVLTPTHSADTSAYKTFDISKLEATFSNTDFTIEYYDDGRLKSINTTSEGQAGGVLKTAVEILSSKLGAFRNEPFPDECDLINRYKTDKDGKIVRTETLTLVYEAEASTQPNSSGGSVQLSTILDDRYDGLLALIGSPMIATGAEEVISPPVDQNSIGKNTDDPILTLRKLSRLKYTVSIEGDGALPQFQTPDIHSETLVLARSSAADYSVPVPKGASFGTVSFEIAVEESGAVSKLKYGSDSGAQQVINVGSAFPDKEEDEAETTADRVAEVKAQADLIAQQARLVRCQAVPEDCK